jgi:hypothetical protein
MPPKLVTVANPEDGRTLTAVHVTCNSNKAAFTRGVWLQKRTETRDLFVNDLFGDPVAVNMVFGGDEAVDEVKITRIGVEIGTKQRRVHIHFTAEVYHYVRGYSLRKLNSRLKEWLNQNSGFDGWAVWIRLLPRRQENYANKVSRQKAYKDKWNEESTHEYERLSDKMAPDVEELNDLLSNLNI